MADTVRTDTEALALLQVGGVGAISAQDVRDAYVTLRGLAGADDEETASFTLSLDHLGKVVRCNHASTPIVVTIPANSSIAFPIGSILNFVQWGAAGVTFSDGGSPGDVDLRIAATYSAEIAEQYGVATLYKQDTNTWLLFGALAEA